MSKIHTITQRQSLSHWMEHFLYRLLYHQFEVAKIDFINIHDKMTKILNFKNYNISKIELLEFYFINK